MLAVLVLYSSTSSESWEVSEQPAYTPVACNTLPQAHRQHVRTTFVCGADFFRLDCGWFQYVRTDVVRCQPSTLLAWTV